jgi:hypothetical protein
VLHRAALDYDLLTRFGWGVEQIPLLGVNRVAGLVDEVMRDPYSHSIAAVAGWSFVPSPQDVSFRNWVDVTAQMNKKKNAAPVKPVERPWEQGARPVWRAPDPNRDVRRKKLRARLGLNY